MCVCQYIPSRKGRWSLRKGGASRRRRGGGPESSGQTARGMAMSDPDGADVQREPSEDECLMVTDIEGGRSVDVGARATGQG